MANSLSLRTHESSDAALDLIESQGLSFPVSPVTDDEVPPLPADLTTLDDEGLMDLFARLTGWDDYVATQMAVAMVDERDTERRMEIAEARAVTSSWGGTSGDRVAIAKAKIALDPEVQELKKEHQDRYAYRKLVETLFNNLERDAALVSRELTRRTSSTPVITRKRNFT